MKRIPVRFVMAGSACALLIACGDGGADAGGADSTVVDTSARTPAVTAPDSSAYALTESGVGPVRVGMSITDAAAATGGAIAARSGAASASCQYLEWRGGPAGVGVMAEQGTVARVDVDSGAVTTAAGARIGDDEPRVRALYGDRVTEMPHKYVAGGRYLVVSSSAADTSLRLVFETEGGRVTRFRGGRMPQVMYVERCG